MTETRGIIMFNRGEKMLVYQGEDVFEGRRIKYKLYLKFDGYRFETDRYYDF